MYGQRLREFSYPVHLPHENNDILEELYKLGSWLVSRKHAVSSWLQKKPTVWILCMKEHRMIKVIGDIFFEQRSCYGMQWNLV